jgi:hypothetical protein
MSEPEWMREWSAQQATDDLSHRIAVRSNRGELLQGKPPAGVAETLGIFPETQE